MKLQKHWFNIKKNGRKRKCGVGFGLFESSC